MVCPSSAIAMVPPPFCAGNVLFCIIASHASGSKCKSQHYSADAHFGGLQVARFPIEQDVSPESVLCVQSKRAISPKSEYQPLNYHIYTVLSYFSPILPVF
jgi:hypothetical protein